ncbi:MAG TPA: glucose 1-dehydrogenase [Thermomicrobiales bacterium]|nr:glucose 1-dehydrogenase [Thermomicrobiales bacterium]
MPRLQDKVAIVTGAASGIGRATAALFAREGARVVVGDRDDEGGPATVASIREEGGDAIFVHVDISKEADCANLVKQTVAHYGRLDVLHNHAGILHPGDGPITELLESVIDETFAINCKGMLFTAKHAVKEMIRGGGGSIVNTGSDLAFVGLANLTAYTASKAAVVGVTRTLAVELAPHNIRVNAVCPGFTYTGMNVDMAADTELIEEMKRDYLIKRLGRPEDIAATVLLLASDESAFTTGAAFVIDGGHTIR